MLGVWPYFDKKEREKVLHPSGFKPKSSWCCGICPTIVLNRLPRSIKSHFCYQEYLTKWTSDTHTANSYKSDYCHIHDVQQLRTGTAVPSNRVSLIEILQCHDVWITILWLWWMVASLGRHLCFSPAAQCSNHCKAKIFFINTKLVHSNWDWTDLVGSGELSIKFG